MGTIVDTSKVFVISHHVVLRAGGWIPDFLKPQVGIIKPKPILQIQPKPLLKPNFLGGKKPAPPPPDFVPDFLGGKKPAPKPIIAVDPVPEYYDLPAVDPHYEDYGEELPPPDVLPPQPCPKRCTCETLPNGAQTMSCV